MLIALPFILGALYTGINLFYFGKESHLLYFICFLVVGLGIFFAKEEINYWYDEKYPPYLDEPIKAWLRSFSPFYNKLQSGDKVKFETRLALYLNARSFQLMLKEKRSIPEDFKAIIASHAIQMTLGLKDFLVGDYDRIICYNHPFPSPGHRFLHTVETHHEDGVILLSLEQLMMSVGQPEKHYNLAFHVYSEALLKLYPKLAAVAAIDPSKVLPYTLDHVRRITGFQDLDEKTLSLVSFFVSNEDFETHFPSEYLAYSEILNYAY